MTSNRNHHVNLPIWKLSKKLLKSTNDSRPQEFKIIHEYDNLRIFTVIAVYGVVSITLSR